jgi:hypothetical protein
MVIIRQMYIIKMNVSDKSRTVDVLFYFNIIYIYISSSLVAPPYRGEGVWVCQGPWELYQR